MNDNTALQVQPAGPAAVQPATPPTVIPDAREVMERIIADANRIPTEATEQVSLVPVSPIEPEPAPQNLAPREPEYQPPAAYESEDYRAIESWLVGAMEVDPQGAADLGAAVLNQMPDLLLTPNNRAYLERVLGVDRGAPAKAVQARVREDTLVNQILSTGMTEVFTEFAEQGRRDLGLNYLESLGLAAAVHLEFEKAIWAEGDSDWKRAYNDWDRRVRTGNALHAADGRKGFRKVFDTVYRRVAERYKHHKPGAPSSQYGNLRGEELMQAMLRDRGAA